MALRGFMFNEMKKMKRLAPEHLNKINEYHQKYDQLALRTEPLDRKIAERFAKWIYSDYVRYENPVAKSIFTNGPLETANFFKAYFNVKSINGLNRRLVGSTVIGAGDYGCTEIEREVQLNISFDFKELIEKHLKKKPFYYDSIRKFSSSFGIYSDYGGSLQTTPFKYYDFMINETGIDSNVQYKKHRKTIELNLIYMLGNGTCVFSEHPNIIHTKNKKLHADGKPALEYRDGTKLWCLNGVNVSEKIAEIPAKDLDPFRLLVIKNAEIRKEFVKKVGIEKILSELKTKIIDRKKKYKLISLDAGDEKEWLYLEMKNPSTGDTHLESVHPDCETVNQALAWRNNMTDFEEPLTLT